MMRNGKMHEAGDVLLVQVQFVDTNEIKKRPVVVLFEEYDNVVVAGITSNRRMKGISLLKKDGAIKDSVIKANYIFTISVVMVIKVLFRLSKEKRNELYNSLDTKLQELIR